jgi:hypothetical protein
MTVVCLEFEQPQNLQAFAEIFYRATPQIMTRGDRFLFLDISKCLGLYSVNTFIKRTFVTLRRAGVRARIGVGDDVPTALSFAVMAQNNKMELPIDTLKYYFDPLGEQMELTQKVVKMTELLKSLGVRTLNDFLRFSVREISTRFSTVGLMAYYRVMGESPVPWKAFQPSEVMTERHEFDLESPVDNLEPIYFKMKTMIDRMQLRLRGKGKRARQFDIVLRQEHALVPAERDYKISICLQLPYVSSKVILQVAKEMVDAQVQAKPIKHRITEFSLVVTEEIPYSMNQKDLFNQRREENEESFFQFVSRVATRLGSKAVFFARMRESYIPEKTWERQAEPPKAPPPVDRLAERPLRLLPTPSQVHFWGKHLCWDDNVDEVESLENREIVFSEWWENSLERVYYRLTTKKGRQLWLYRTAAGDFLQGEFD